MAPKAKQPNPNPPDDDDDGDGGGAEAFSPSQLEIINNTVTAAVTAHVKRGLKPMQDQLAVLPTIQETLEKLAGGGKQNEGGGDEGKAKQQQQQAAQPDPEKVAMKKRLDAIEAEREQERASAREARRDTALTEIATKAGVEKNRIRGVVALMRGEAKYDKESGNYFMTVNRHGVDEQVSLEEGAASFFKSDEGKSYLAPTSAAPRGGSGQGRGTTTTAGVTQRSNAPAKGANGAKEEKKQAAAEAFVGAVGELFGGGNINVGG